MKSLGHADPSSNPVTVNIYGLPDLVQRKYIYPVCSSGQCSEHNRVVRVRDVVYPKQKKPFSFTVGRTFAENNDQRAIRAGS